MSHVPFPFKNEGVINFKNPDSDKNDIELKTEIAESKMEIFQSWCYRKSNQINNLRPILTLNFKDPYQQHFVLFDYDFDVLVTEVDTNGVVSNHYEVARQINKGFFIKIFYGSKMVILTEVANAVQYRHRIENNITQVDLKFADNNSND